VRPVHLQWFRHRALCEHALTQRALDEVIPARLGDIVDRHGRLLVTTAKTNSLFVDPSRIADPEAVAAPLAAVLGQDAGRLVRRLVEHKHRRFLWVQRHLTVSEADRVINLALPEPVWGFREEFIRVYPQGRLAAHVLGWRNIDGVPQAGVERTLDALLHGTDGRRTLVRDARGYVIEVLEEVTQSPRQGGTVTLTLDVDIQRIAEDAVDLLVAQRRPHAVAAVVLAPQSGEILAMLSRPAFDPGCPSADQAETWKNHAVSSAYEPGSTLKPCIAAWAVEQRLVSLEERFLCNGEYRMGQRVLHDHHPFGKLDVAGIIAHSSNIGMAQIGQRLGNEVLFTAVRNFGFGDETGVELPGESPGIVRPLERWDRYSTGSIPMGQEIAATPLQVIAAHAVLASGGLRITPHLVLRTPGGGRQTTDVLATQVLSPQTAHWMTAGPMVDVVRHGTAKQAAIRGVDVFAKTGTAQKLDAETGTYASDRYVSSCVCGAPAEAPRLLVLVTVDEPATSGNPSGGTVAAPVAADILRQALAVLETSPPSPRVPRRVADESHRERAFVNPSRR
ncbi:MAG: peptidoglycan D,D-transpeptidase FtsI family protein, partial [Planctomycetaceae bacterium]